jgi:hypothetical protein
MNRAPVGLILAGLLVAVGCERSEPTPPPRTTTTNPNIPSRTTDAVRDTRDAAIASWHRQLDDIKTKVDTLRAKAANASIDTRAAYQDAVKGVSDQCDALQSKLNDFRDTGSSSAWDSLKSSMDSGISHLNSSLRDVMDKYSNP